MKLRWLSGLLVAVVAVGSANAKTCEARVRLPLSALSKAADPANASPRDAVARYRDRDQIMISYIKGVADGYTWAGAAERAAGPSGGKLFCEPDNVSFTADLAIGALETYLNKVERVPDRFDPCGSLPFVILHAFQSAWPCPA